MNKRIRKTVNTDAISSNQKQPFWQRISNTIKWEDFEWNAGQFIEIGFFCRMEKIGWKSIKGSLRIWW